MQTCNHANMQTHASLRQENTDHKHEIDVLLLFFHCTNSFLSFFQANVSMKS